MIFIFDLNCREVLPSAAFWTRRSYIQVFSSKPSECFSPSLLTHIRIGFGIPPCPSFTIELHYVVLPRCHRHKQGTFFGFSVLFLDRWETNSAAHTQQRTKSRYCPVSYVPANYSTGSRCPASYYQCLDMISTNLCIPWKPKFRWPPGKWTAAAIDGLCPCLGSG